MNGQAVLSTVLLPSGADSIKSSYGGDGTYAASSSAVLAQTVSANASNGFQLAVNYPAGTDPVATMRVPAA